MPSNLLITLLPLSNPSLHLLIISSMAEVDHWRMQLNNYLQANGGYRLLSWEVYQAGPQHQPIWTAIAYIRGVEYGRSCGSSQNAVKEEAARQTLHALLQDRRRGYA